MSECWVALACQRDQPSEHAVALSALVQALKQQDKAAGAHVDAHSTGRPYDSIACSNLAAHLVSSSFVCTNHLAARAYICV
jgi:hypothetical protein